MSRYLVYFIVVLLTLLTLAAALVWSPWWLIVCVPVGMLALMGTYDLFQHRHSVLRNYPVLGHFRFTMESIRPEIQQYFVESNTDGRPYNRDARSLIYERAKGDNEEKAFGTENDVYRVGQEFLAHSFTPLSPPTEHPRVMVGGPQCSQPYSMALLNVSAMSFGALSAQAIMALNRGAKAGNFAHDTGEGGLSEYHLRNGGDLVWEIGSAYFGCRTRDGRFDPAVFKEKAVHPSVKCISVKLSQGAKPGIGGVMPAAKMSPEIAAARGVPAYEKCVSPPAHSAFDSPVGLLEFIAQLRDDSGGKPVGFKLCASSPRHFLSICKAMIDSGIQPDFIIVDGAEGGTGAAPLEFEDHMGLPLTEGLLLVHDALVGCDLKTGIKIGAAGKISSGADIVKRIIHGADYTNAARAMMMALGCIQSQRCHTNRCPVGVTTQDPKRTRALVIPDKAERVRNFQHETVASAVSLMSAMGLRGPHELNDEHLYFRMNPMNVMRFDELHTRLQQGQLLSEPPQWWKRHWEKASPDVFIR